MSRFSLGRTVLLLVSAFGLMALFASSAVASGPPIVTIGSTTEHSLNTAVVNGTVDKNGASSVTYKVEYGKTKSYGKTTSSKTVTTSGSVPISAIAYGLESMTTYHARISATNSFGTTVTEDIVFEMLLQWKVGGETITEAYEKAPYRDGVPYELYSPPPTLAIAGTTAGGTRVNISCEGPSEHREQSDYNYGVLGVRYHQKFINCKTFLNGTESKACQPKSFTQDLNGVMVPAASDIIEMGELCPVGEGFSLAASGFEVGAMPEAKQHLVTLTEHLSFWGMTVTETGEGWQVLGNWLGKTFGIS